MPVTEASQVGDARRVLARLTADIGLPENERNKASLVITELGNNLVKYAVDGQLVIRALTDERDTGVEILSLDSGPGFADISKRIADGYSSGGTPGNGLGAVQRLSTTFDIFSAPGVGTAILSRVVQDVGAGKDRALLEFGCVCVPIKGEEKCGDSWAVAQDGSKATLMLVDGLGHGLIAATAADAAVETFQTVFNESPTEIVTRTHQALRSTRGAVMAVAEARFADNVISYSGVGNVACCQVVDGDPQHMVSVNGTLGLAAKPRAFNYTWKKDAVIVFNSDGLQNRWKLERYPGLFRRHPSIIAGVL